MGKASLRDRVLSRLTIEPGTGCLLWTGSLQSEGYGSVRAPGNDSRLYVHRLMYEWFVGPIPEGLVIDHLCRVRHCASPAHLEAVTTAENIRRGVSPAALMYGRTHCKHGHEFTLENTYMRTSGQPSPRRCCRACRREALRRFRKKAAARSNAGHDTEVYMTEIARITSPAAVTA